MNGGKDIKFGHDKRKVSIVPKSEVNLYNIANGELLTDEFGNPVITEVDIFYLPDATTKRSTSIVFNDRNTPYQRLEYKEIGVSTAVYGDFDVYVSVGVGTTGGSEVGFGTTVETVSGEVVTLENYPYLEVRTVADQGVEKNKIYFNTDVGISTILGVSPGDAVSGGNIIDGTLVSKVYYGDTVVLSKDATNVGVKTDLVTIDRGEILPKKSDVVWKIEEQFRESSEVSTTLLGVNRAETQLSLFSNVSSYGLDPDEFEFYAYVGGVSFGTWERRKNALYGNRYPVAQLEETQESAIKITSFPTPYSYPFGPKFEKLGYYNADLFNRYLSFIQLGNDLFNYFNGAGGSGYPEEWKNKFLPPDFAYVDSGDVVYVQGFATSFAQIDTWTDTWRDIKDALLIDPVTDEKFNFSKVSEILETTSYDSTTTRPGYSETSLRYGFLQSRRVFRYQPGRISGFTFGLRSSVEPVTGIVLEWGISNKTDQYVFKVEAGQFSIVRRSTIPLETPALLRSNLTLADQVRKKSGDPYDDTEYWTVDIPRDKFNGDPLNGNGPSKYLLQPENVTMYKIEFGWYGAIGARFYAYVPIGNGEARWIVVHTLVIENSLSQPCLEDSYFRLKYSVNIQNTGDVRTPQFIYKYGASYYIDGGDEGTTTTFSVGSKDKQISGVQTKTLLGITPKDFLYNTLGVPIANRKLIIPTKLNISTDSLTEVKIVKCTACPGFGHVYTPGIASTEIGRYIEAEFTGTDTIAALNETYFSSSDVGAKLIAPSLYNAYIASVDDQVGEGDQYESATIKGYRPINASQSPTLFTRAIGGELVLDRALGITTNVGVGTTYPHLIRLSNYDSTAISNFPLTGSEIEINFLNPLPRETYTQYSDFLIGLTDVEPIVQEPDILTGFELPGIGATTILPNSKILFGEHTHTVAFLNEDGVETTEDFWPTSYASRMEIDDRLPSVANPGGGRCSRIKATILSPLEIKNANEFNYLPNGGSTEPDAEGRTWIQIQGAFPAVDYDGGQIAVLNQETNDVNVTGSRFVGLTTSYVGAGGSVFSYIQTSQTLGAVGSNFTILIRPIKIEGTFLNKSKLFNYNPYPLYLIAKLRDNSAINNISVKEKLGDFQRTISPKWYVINAEVTNAGGNADTSGIPPTNFQEFNRLSSALVDNQNEQQLRPVTVKDTFYIGANETKSIDLDKVFGADRTVITPDNNNTEATFIVAKKIDGTGTGTADCSINFKEQ